MAEHTAVVVGGGIGGLSAAIALHRAGLKVEVFERAPELTEIGAGLSLWPNALRALDLLGVLEPVLKLGAIESGGGIRDRQGRWLSRGSADELARRYGYPLIVVHRAELLRVLREALPPDLLRSGVDIAEIPQADLVVAADGLHSTMRSKLFPGHTARYAGYTAWRMVIDFPSVTESAVTWGNGERFGFIPMAYGQVYGFATANAAADGVSPDGEYAELLRRFASWPDPIPALLAATGPQSVLRHDIYDLPPVPTFTDGRMVLLGDAAHGMTPNLGQGACQALEDAVTLADCLQETADVPTALSRYDALRRPRTQAIVRRSAKLGLIGQLSWPPAVVARNLAIRLAPASIAMRSMDDILGWRM